MQLERTVGATRQAVSEARRAGKRIALVPTMGYLHEGHLSLIDLAREHADFVVVSIFVNPKQFGPSEDLATYPRDERRDRTALESRHVDLLFAPYSEEIYPARFATKVTLGGVAEPLEGQRRPGHFDGVATVVLKLLNIVQPDVAIFGQKDAQQCAVIRKLVHDLDLPVQIEIGAIRRDPDGVAMSSRNSYLSEHERGKAPLLIAALKAGREVLERDGTPEEAEQAMLAKAQSAPDLRIDYLRVVDPETFERPGHMSQSQLLVGAVYVGTTRLIDNLQVAPPGATAGRNEP